MSQPLSLPTRLPTQPRRRRATVPRLQRPFLRRRPDERARPAGSVDHPAPRVERRAPQARPAVDSPVLRVVGLPARDPAPDTDEPAPPSLRELAFIDRINEIKPAEHNPPGDRLPRLYDEDYAILALLDRAGLVLPSMVARAVRPGKDIKNIRHRLNKLYEHGLIARSRIGVSDHSTADGRLPSLCSITRHGLTTAQARTPPAVHPQREWRAGEQRRPGTLPHDLHALSWAIEFHRIVGEAATDYWRTPRYATGRFPVPQIGNGHRRHPITAAELPVPEGHAVLDLAPFREIKPDLALELRLPEQRLTFDLLVELDLTGRPSYNHDKLKAYDAFLTGWAMSHPRYRALGTRPAVVFVFRDHRTALACAKEANPLLTGRSGPMGAAGRQWDFVGRQHLFFAAEPDIHRGSLRAFALPDRPLDEHGTDQDPDVQIRVVSLLALPTP